MVFYGHIGSQHGLMLYMYVGPDVPLENIDALCEAYGEYCF
jgi:hypothetical protein